MKGSRAHTRARPLTRATPQRASPNPPDVCLSHLTSTRRGSSPKNRDDTPSASATKAADSRKPGDAPPKNPGTLHKPTTTARAPGAERRARMVMVSDASRTVGGWTRGARGERLVRGRRGPRKVKGALRSMRLLLAVPFDLAFLSYAVPAGSIRGHCSPNSRR